MNFVVSERLRSVSDTQDVVLSVARIEAVFGKPGEKGSRYHEKGSWSERLLEWWTARRAAKAAKTASDVTEA